MSESEFQFSNQFVQLYCHGIQMRCDDLFEILKTGNVDIRRRMQNGCFDLYDMKCVDQTIVSCFDNYHLLMFKNFPPSDVVNSCAVKLTNADTLHDVLMTLSDSLRENGNPVQLKLEHKGENTEISLAVDSVQTDLDAEAVQFLLVLRLFKLMRIISWLAESAIPVYAVKLMGELNELTTPYIKAYHPEFIYHRQKRNSVIIPTRCLTMNCKKHQDDFADFLRQNADILVNWRSGKKSGNSLAPHPHLKHEPLLPPKQQNPQALKEMQEEIINKKTIELMMNSSIPASEIGRRLGLSNSTGFSRSFKEMNKVKPGEFRNGRIIRLN